MTSGPDHYRRAEQLLGDLANLQMGSPREAIIIAEAQVHATLALAAASTPIRRADVPGPGPVVAQPADLVDRVARRLCDRLGAGLTWDRLAETGRDQYRDEARALLDDLHQAGRLIPAEADVEERWDRGLSIGGGIPWRQRVLTIVYPQEVDQ